jgi:hypothetical protein
LLIYLGVKGNGKMKLETQQGLDITLDGAEKMRVTIRNNTTRQSEVGPNMMEEEVCGLSNKGIFMAWEKECHLREMTNDHPYNIVFGKSGLHTTQKFHGNGLPGMGGHW